MKLTERLVNKFLNNFHYELTKSQLESEWQLDFRNEYNKTKRCYNFHNFEGCWLELPENDLAECMENSDLNYSEGNSTTQLELFSLTQSKLLKKAKEIFPEDTIIEGIRVEKDFIIVFFLNPWERRGLQSKKISKISEEYNKIISI